MRLCIRTVSLFVLAVALLVVTAAAQNRNVKALVGGTLIDGYGSLPVRNSVIIIEGEKIKAVGQLVIKHGKRYK